MPGGLCAKIYGVVIDEEKQDATNFTKLPTTDMGDTPLAFLADQSLNKDKWSVTTGYASFQKVWKDAYARSLELLWLPKNRRAYQDLEAKTVGPKAKDDLKKWYVDGKKAAALEANLLMVDGVTQMCWVPNKLKIPEGDLLGHYKLVVRRQNGDLEALIPSNDWVKANFREDVLGLVQRVAYEVGEILPFDTKKVTASRLTGYLKVENEGITISATDTRVVN